MVSGNWLGFSPDSSHILMAHSGDNDIDKYSVYAYPVYADDLLKIAAWLEAKEGRSGSQKTARVYRDAPGGFRAQLALACVSLDNQPIALASRGATVVSTYNQRLPLAPILSLYLAIAPAISTWHSKGRRQGRPTALA